MENISHRPADSTAPAIKAVLFDLGGVLVRLGGPAVVRSWFEDRLSDQEIWDLWLDSPTIRAYERGLIETEEFGRRAVKEFGWSLTPDEFLDAFSKFILGLYPRVPLLLQSIRPDVRRACLSNSNALHWSRLSDDLGLAALLDRSYASHIIGEVKPDAAAFQKAIDGLALAPSQILYLDDLQRNVDAGRALGLTAELVCGDHELEATLERYRLLV